MGVLVAVALGRLGRPRYLLLALLLLSLLGGGGATTALIWADYRDSLAEAKARARHQARLLEESVSRALDSGDVALRRAANRVIGRPSRLTVPDAAHQEILRTILAEAGRQGAFHLFDPTGVPLYSTHGPAMVDSAERMGLAAVARRLDVSAQAAPLPVGDGVSLALARPLFLADGGLAGLLAVTVPLTELAALAEDEAGPPARLALFRQDGVLVAAYPSGEGAAAAVLGRHLFSQRLPAQVSGTFVLSEGEAWSVASYRSLPGRALVVAASLDGAEALRPWRQRTAGTLVAAVMVMVTLVTILALLGREMRREREASAALRQVNRELGRSNADLEQFAYVASHDLKEPLRNIASYVQLLQRRYQGRLDEDADAFIGYTVDGVRRLQMIINELLAYSRIGTGPLHLLPVQTGGLLSAVLANLKTAIAEAGAAVEVVGRMPVVNGDSGQLSSLFQNLIGNGLKYRRDDVRPEITVSVADSGAFWRFSVADNGIGIDPLYHKQIFELFKRLHGRARYSGTGIGLAVCQRVVERHGGEIWVESQPGLGATFHFTLPKL